MHDAESGLKLARRGESLAVRSILDRISGFTGFASIGGKQIRATRCCSNQVLKSCNPEILSKVLLIYFRLKLTHSIAQSFVSDSFRYQIKVFRGSAPEQIIDVCEKWRISPERRQVLEE